jgi:hypothetical protein
MQSNRLLLCNQPCQYLNQIFASPKLLVIIKYDPNTTQGFDKALTEGVLDQAKRFFSLPLEKKMEVDTALVPNEYVGYHAMASYNRNGRKYHG